MVLVWLAAMAYGMVWGAERFARILGIPDDVMGVSITAIGASLPSLFSSIIAAKQGFANMAISNAFGANLCSILLAFGMPCFIYSAAVNPLAPYICDSGAIITTVAVLVVALVVFVIVASVWRLSLSWPHGIFFVLLYVALLSGIVVLQLLHIKLF
jgi:Ca2+/Na+ antiporter